jgi:hypothetical protein
MPNACCCYLINQGYLLPTLLSARQARSAISADVGDVIVFCIDTRSDSSKAFEAAYRDSGIELHFIPPVLINHLPIMFARFFLHKLLDPKYKSILYIDGDTQIAGSLDPLLTIPLQSAPFLAARDPMSILLREGSHSTNGSYLRSIGIEPDKIRLYCNSGVLRLNLPDWKEIGERVLQISAERGHNFKFPDQDPLNIAFGGTYLTMSYKWNFPIFFQGLGLQDEINPTILHFMSNPRPWDGPFRPWGRPHFDAYDKLTDQFPQLRPLRRKINRLYYVKYYLQQYYKKYFELPTWNTPDVRRRIKEIEGESYI